jgi:hypothetical protein
MMASIVKKPFIILTGFFEPRLDGSGLTVNLQEALEAFKAAIETGEMTGFKDGGMQAD